jgi:hypothetical protein
VVGVNVVNTKLPTQPVQAEIAQGIGNFTGRGALYTVPTGKRLVLEYFSSEVGVATGTSIDRYALDITDNPTSGNSSFGHFIAPAYHSPCGTCAAGSELFVASQPIRMYVDAGKVLTVSVTFSNSPGPNVFGFFAISGYLVDAP